MSSNSHPVLAKIIEVLDAEGPQSLRGRYRQGDVFAVAKSEMPICTVAIVDTGVGAASNAEDDHLVGIAMNVIYDATRDLLKDYRVAAGTTTLYDLVQGLDATTLALKEETILYVLRKYQVLDSPHNLWIAVGSGERVTVSYGVRAERRGPGMYSVEAVLRFNARLHIARPGL